MFERVNFQLFNVYPNINESDNKYLKDKLDVSNETSIHQYIHKYRIFSQNVM